MSRRAALAGEHPATGPAATGPPDAATDHAAAGQATRRTPRAAARLRGSRKHGLARAHPVASVAYVAALALATLVLANPLEVVLLLGLIVAVLAAAHRLRASLPYVRLALYVALFLAILNPLFSQGGLDVLWQAHLLLLHIRLTIQGLAFGAVTGLRLVAVMLAFALYTVVLDPDDQLALMSRFSFRSGLVVSLATRLFPVLQRDAGRIADAQRSRGVELDRGPRRTRAAARVPLLAALFTQSLERAMDVGSAMTARGYGRRGRTRWQGTRRWHAGDRVALAAAGVATVALVGGLVAGAFHYNYFPLLDDPRAALASPWWLAAFAALVAPLVLELTWLRSRV